MTFVPRFSPVHSVFHIYWRALRDGDVKKLLNCKCSISPLPPKTFSLADGLTLPWKRSSASATSVPWAPIMESEDNRCKNHSLTRRKTRFSPTSNRSKRFLWEREDWESRKWSKKGEDPRLDVGESPVMRTWGLGLGAEDRVWGQGENVRKRDRDLGASLICQSHH